MENKRVYEVGEEFFDNDLGFKVRCVEDASGSCDSCCMKSTHTCYTIACMPAERESTDCKTPVNVYFEKVD